MKNCFLFPGQGAQYPGMGKDLWENNSKVKQLFQLASDKTGINMEKLLFEGTEEDLRATDKTQIAITLVNLSASLVLKEHGIIPAGAAGFSLGEYAALCEAGVISIDDIFPIVKARGDAMEKASRSLDSQAGNPGMAAVIGLSYEQIDQAVKSAGLSGVYLANINSSSQIVVSGTFDGIKNAEAVLKTAGAKRYIPLKVSGPFHSPLLNDARDKMASVLAGYTYSDPKLPVYTNVTGNLIKSGADAKKYCIDQIVSPVKWVIEEENILKDGYNSFFEVGPGAVLSGFLAGATKEFKCVPAGKLADINNIAK